VVWGGLASVSVWVSFLSDSHFLVLLLVSFLFGQVFDRVKLTPNTLCGGGQPCANTANFIFQFHPESARVDRLASSELSLASILAVEAAVVFLFQFSQAM
jgi:hypothetical protein